MSAVQQNDFYTKIEPIADLDTPITEPDFNQPNPHHSLSTVIEGDVPSPAADTLAFSWNDSYLPAAEPSMAQYETLATPMNMDNQSADEIEIKDSSMPYSHYVRSQYGNTPETSKNRTTYETSKIITIKPPQLKVLKPRKLIDPLQGNLPEERILIPSQYDSLSRRSLRHESQAMSSNGSGGQISSPYDYWTIPRNPLLEYKNQEGSQMPFVTPGSFYLTERSSRHRSSHRSSHHHKHKREKKTSSKESNGHSKHINSDYRKVLEKAGLIVSQSSNDKNDERNKLKVYFRFSRGTLTDPYTMDFNQNEELLLYFQAHCRGWLARERFKKRKTEDEAVRCIQRNANVAFDKWLHLLFALKPLIKTHRTEEELLFLRSELERYKSLVRMLRFENAEYQAKVANLLQLLEQINTGGSSNSDVKKLVGQISDALAKNQEFWTEMAEKNKSMQVAALQGPSPLAEPPRTPIPDQSPISKLKHDADFYRDQVELLREEADEQNLRSAEHHQSQVGIMAKRVEELQDLLTMESNKVERLTLELEDRNNAISEAKTYERSLEHMVNQLSRQLDQRSKSVENLRHGNGHMNNANAGSVDNLDKDKENLNELQSEVDAYRDYLSKVKQYLDNNPEVASMLNNTPLKPGGELDLSAPPTNITVTYQDSKQMSSQPMQQFFQTAPTPTREDNADLTPRSSANHETVELRRKLAALQGYLVDLEERAKNESDAREELENENYNLNDRVVSLDRQVRHTQDELEELVKRDLTNQRTLKDLQEQLDEELRKASKLQQMNTELEQRLAEQRRSPEPEDDLMTKELESIKNRLKKDAQYYKQSYDQIRDEFEQYRIDHDPTAMQQMIEEKEEKLNVLEKEKQHWRMEMDIQQVKLQNATQLLEDTETRLKMLNRERAAQMHRMAQLEAERDEAIRKAATVTGRATADRETAAAKLREMDELRIERDMLRKELSEVKQALAGSTAENNAEKRQLKARLRERDTHNEAHISDLRNELERTREEIERLQDLLRTTQDSESNLRSSNQHQKWKISELEDQISHYARRTADLERQRADLDAELSRARADLTLPRETASLRRAGQKLMADEWLQLAPTSEDEFSDEDEKPSLGTDKSIKMDENLESVGDNLGTNGGESISRRSYYRSNPNLNGRLNRSEFLSRSSLDRQSPYRGSPVSFETKHTSLKNLNSPRYRSSDLKLATSLSSPRPESAEHRSNQTSMGSSDISRPSTIIGTTTKAETTPTTPTKPVLTTKSSPQIIAEAKPVTTPTSKDEKPNPTEP